MKLVVVGGNAAGMSGASKAKRRQPDLEVEVLEAGDDISYSTCGVPFLVEGLVEEADQLRVLSPAKAQKRGLKIHTQTKVIAMNPYTKEVVYEGPQGRDSVHYDRLLLATGTRPRNPFEGGNLPGVHTIRHLGDGLRLRDALDAKKSPNVAVIGGGYAGLEMAAAMQARGAQVNLFARKRLLSTMDEDITDGLAAWLAEADIEVHLNADVKRITGEKRVEGVEVGKKSHEADAAIVAVGLEPCTEFAVKAGIASDKAGYLLVDDQMKTNLHDVWAAGDCVAAKHLITGQAAPLPLALPANRMGRIAGDNIGASLDKIPGPGMYYGGGIGTTVIRLFGLAFAKTGLSEHEAKSAGFDVASSLIESPTKAGYMPELGEMAVKMVGDRDTGKLLGVQLACPEDAALRINSAAVAIHAGMKVARLADVETAYAPPFSPVWDPILVAASECAKHLRA